MTLKEKVSRKLETLQEYLGYLKGYQGYTVTDLKRDHTVRGAVERYFHLSAECVIDIAEMIIADRGLRKPEEYRECIEILGEADILPDKFAYRFHKTDLMLQTTMPPGNSPGGIASNPMQRINIFWKLRRSLQKSSFL